MEVDADLFCTSKKKESVLFICNSYIARRMGRGAFKASCVIYTKKGGHLSCYIIPCLTTSVKNCFTHHLEANLGLLIQTLQGVSFVKLSVISATAGVVRVMLLVLLSLVSLWILRHRVDLPLGRVQHDGQNL